MFIKKNFLKASFLLSVPLSAPAMEQNLQSLSIGKSSLRYFLSQKQNREINRKLIKSRPKKKILLPSYMRQPNTIRQEQHNPVIVTNDKKCYGELKQEIKEFSQGLQEISQVQKHNNSLLSSIEDSIQKIEIPHLASLNESVKALEKEQNDLLARMEALNARILSNK